MDFQLSDTRQKNLKRRIKSFSRSYKFHVRSGRRQEKRWGSRYDHSFKNWFYIYKKVAWNPLKSILSNKHKHHDHAFELKDLEGSLHDLVLFFFYMVHFLLFSYCANGMNIRIYETWQLTFLRWKHIREGGAHFGHFHDMYVIVYFCKMCCI